MTFFSMSIQSNNQLLALCLMVLELGVMIEAVASGRVAYRIFSAAFLVFGQVRGPSVWYFLSFVICLGTGSCCVVSARGTQQRQARTGIADIVLGSTDVCGCGADANASPEIWGQACWRHDAHVTSPDVFLVQCGPVIRVRGVCCALCVCVVVAAGVLYGCDERCYVWRGRATKVWTMHEWKKIV